MTVANSNGNIRVGFGAGWNVGRALLDTGARLFQNVPNPIRPSHLGVSVGGGDERCDDFPHSEKKGITMKIFKNFAPQIPREQQTKGAMKMIALTRTCCCLVLAVTVSSTAVTASAAPGVLFASLNGGTQLSGAGQNGVGLVLQFIPNGA